MKNIVVAVCMLCAVFAIQAQETVPSSGGEAAGSGGSSSYTVGQLVYTTNTGTNGSVSQGVQQSFEFFTLSNPEITSINLSAQIHPNPTSEYIILNISDVSLNNLSYTLNDVSGKLISQGKITNPETQIKMHQLESAIYLLRVVQNNQELKTFKIIKKL